MTLLVIIVIPLIIHARIGMSRWNADLTGVDEAAHFTTGVMVYDYLKSAPQVTPVAFAQNFYVHYPKVALGHWPPVFYVIQAAWYLPFGATVTSARALCALITVITAMVLMVSLLRTMGGSIALLSMSCFLMLPIIQEVGWLVMSDILEALLIFLAILAFGSYLEFHKKQHLIWFVAWSVLAILTKGSAWAIGLFAILAPLLTRQLWCFRSVPYWLSGFGIVFLSAPFYIFSWIHSLGYSDSPTIVATTAPILSRLRLVRDMDILALLPSVILIIAVAALCFRSRPNKLRTPELAAATWILSQVIFLAILPLTGEARYFLPSVAPTLILFALGLRKLRTALTEKGVPYAGMTSFAIAGFAMVLSWRQSPERIVGYTAVAASLPFYNSGTVTLLSSDALGEGAIIAARLERDTARKDIVLRQSKTLFHATWSGGSYVAVYRTPEQVNHFLQQVPVRYIVMDDSAVKLPAQALLQACLDAAPQLYRLIGRFPIRSDRNGRSGQVAVYQNFDAPEGTPRSFELDLGPSHNSQRFRTTRVQH